ncbi:hypothetical protein TPHA_0G02450 [Tetrapisispora phaffii CBS 4417]|uniref:Phosphoglycerate mutase n=1 Tax=Tetrapisispora phaffii (strain ATCC 24235 / CBS 4417 / NBRC 1672 / NRRL Y-8282 / UCD 70-5) TaxID=1071381 RepID=G8BW02_TETPH|nr:hypothetical protein TPHA_0G02450 [Tetrapisispora phaffii CBS 4417]CCE64080.1 hypothetical protein TPHA_0G02450 [Tetrapisispora phaffii CBS 4417]
MPFRALPSYFRGYHESESTGVDSSLVNHLELVKHINWKELYESIPVDNEQYNYKLVIFARHGQGYHNAAIERYGMPEWDSKWALLDGDEYGNWLDSRLTNVGREQVRTTGSTILSPIVNDLGMLPHKFFSSPMRRCLETFVESWNVCLRENSDIHCLTDVNDIEVNIYENIREILGRHPCDKRVNHSKAIKEYQPSKLPIGITVNWVYEPEYPEEDKLWTPTREKISDMDKRILNGLVQIFQQTTSADRFISVTCHSGVINSILRNIKHPRVDNLQTGNVVIAVVEIDKQKLGQHPLQ